ncbi:type I-C CRISPR-associated protein Cas5c [Gordonibacter pamelaeae]|uniref:type I-C CRISPR-associated protein Cas5c n=1 Tax=Gordonibacter pamelaeae TaxID=471189 RepID=UPI0012AF2AD9|nr:type I-C CRISPR-associated protein Cas5c [Gordonibacter pamelaeae]MCQ4846295.1 type I-C CRISPR-associated protein Cas5c [Gordonibacter pamelaeae]MCQ4850771.1 type I-C CRISPR-associated protein Cas5c [Gordonibacter pamelaeae]MSA61801.1 type I-C CRISPR-associated protein Cas5 [Gordonibacter pamelaeae]
MRYKNSISYLLWGREALFSDPIMRVGGEKCSYPVPTYQALKGITESIYWKPTLIWIVDRVRVMHPIRSQSKGMCPMKEAPGKNDLALYTYLTDVAYQVEAHFVWNEARTELIADRNEHKHFSIAKRMLERGGRRDIFLGTRECQGYVEPCTFGSGEGAYDDVDEMPLGMMFHGFDYADETGENMMRTRFWRPRMRKGIIDFCPPDRCPVVRTVKNQKPMSFEPGVNLTLCEDEEGWT